MQNVVVFGCTQFTFMLIKMMEAEEAANIAAITVNESFINEKTQQTVRAAGYKLIPFERLQALYPPNQYKMLNSLGYTKLGELKASISKEIEKKGYQMFSYISKNASIYSDIAGQGNIVLPNAFIGSNVELGDYNVVYAGCTLTHDIKIGDNCFLAAGSTVGGRVEIGNHCFIGMNATIKNKVNIDDFTLIGAATYITENTQKYGVYVPERSKKLNKNSLEML